MMDEHTPIATAMAAEQGLLNVGDADAAAGLATLLGNTAKGSLSRRRAAWVLARMPLQSAVAVPALIRASQDPDAEMREQAASSLRELGKVAGEAAPALRLMLSDAAPRVRIAAASALYAIRASDDLAVKTLIGETRNPDYLVRRPGRL